MQAAYVRRGAGFGDADADVHESQEVAPGVVLDYDREDNVVAIEVLQLSTRRPGTSKDRIEIETA